jgi:hypothetical protein
MKNWAEEAEGASDTGEQNQHKLRLCGHGSHQAQGGRGVAPDQKLFLFGRFREKRLARSNNIS